MGRRAGTAGRGTGLTAPSAAASAIVWFDEVDSRSVAIAGGKGASLAKMSAAGHPVPPGFVIRADALMTTLEQSNAVDDIRRLLRRLRHDQAASPVAEQLMRIVLQSAIGDELAEQIRAAYGRLGDETPVAVRSSACAEDGEAASYAGQQETYLNVRGGDDVLRHVRDCWASFFTERALFYRRQKGSLEDLAMAVVIQRQLDPEKSGVLFTIDPVQRRRDQMVVEAAWGLGEAVVQGLVVPDHYVVSREGRVKQVRVARQEVAIVRSAGGGTQTIQLDPEQGAARVLDDDELERLAEFGRSLQESFGAPQDIEWAIEKGELYLLQSRPVTT